LTYSFSSGTAAAQQQTITVSANGQPFTYNTAVTNGSFPAGVLTVSSGATGTISNTGTAVVGVQVNPTGGTVSGLAPGSYAGSISITGGTQAITVNVVANVGNALVPTFVTASSSSASLSSTGVLNVNLPTALAATVIGTLNVNSIASGNTNVSAPTINFTAPGTGWLTDTATGCSGNITTTVTCANVLSINTTGLAAGSYAAMIVFTSTTSGVASLSMPVNLTVTAGPTFLQSSLVSGTSTAAVAPVRLVLTGAPGLTLPLTGTTCIGSNTAASSSTCQLAVGTNFGSVNNVSITPATTSGGSWLSVNGSTIALTGQVISPTATNLTITANTTNLAPRTYTGTVTVSGAGATPLVIPVSVVVLPANPSAAGVYRSSNGLFLEDSLFARAFNSADFITFFAGSGMTPQATDIPVTGDWSGSGTSKIGLYRPSTGTWFLDYNGNGIFDGPTVDRQYQYGGLPGDIPVVGDWNGTGFSKVGLFRAGSLFILNSSGSGSFTGGTSDQVFGFGGLTGCTGLPGIYSTEPAGSCDIPVTGDWNSSGTTKVGIVRAAPGTSTPFLWILDNSGTQAFVAPGAGVTNPSTIFAFGGIAGDLPIVGDWNNTGSTNVGVFRAGFLWVEDTSFKIAQAATTPPSGGDTLVVFAYGGITGDVPVVGRWR